MPDRSLVFVHLELTSSQWVCFLVLGYFALQEGITDLESHWKMHSKIEQKIQRVPIYPLNSCTCTASLVINSQPRVVCLFGQGTYTGTPLSPKVFSLH